LVESEVERLAFGLPEPINNLLLAELSPRLVMGRRGTGLAPMAPKMINLKPKGT
jgi:hypothetical protein